MWPFAAAKWRGVLPFGSVVETRSLWADSRSRSHFESPVRADVLDRAISGDTGVENVTSRIVFFVRLHRVKTDDEPRSARYDGPNPGQKKKKKKMEPNVSIPVPAHGSNISSSLTALLLKL